MRLIDEKNLQPGVQRHEILAWACYDFANSGYTTVVLTAVFSAYFVNVIAAGVEEATFMWTVAIGLSNLIGMFTMPLIATLADEYAAKKKFLFLATALCIAGTLALSFSGPGLIYYTLFMIVISNVGYIYGETLNSAFLPELAHPACVGKVSGWGWSFGYLGGMLTLAGSFFVVSQAGSEAAAIDHAISMSLWIVAGVFAVASLPFFFFLKERAQPRPSLQKLDMKKAALASFAELKHTFQSLHEFKDFGWLALCGFFYNCGIQVVISLSAVYASAVMGFTVEETIMMVFFVNITAAIGAFLFGYVQDRVGHKLALTGILLVWIGMIVLATLATTKLEFKLAANLAGLAMGSSQSAGRAMVALFAPKRHSAEFFGFWNMSLWLAAIIGPITYGAITWITDNNHRFAFQVTSVFFVLAIVALQFVKIARGQRQAWAYDAATHKSEDA